MSSGAKGLFLYQLQQSWIAFIFSVFIDWNQLPIKRECNLNAWTTPLPTPSTCFPDDKLNKWQILKPTNSSPNENQNRHSHIGDRLQKSLPHIMMINLIMTSSIRWMIIFVYICICSAQLSMSYMEKRHRNKIILLFTLQLTSKSWRRNTLQSSTNTVQSGWFIWYAVAASTSLSMAQHGIHTPACHSPSDNPEAAIIQACENMLALSPMASRNLAWQIILTVFSFISDWYFWQLPIIYCLQLYSCSFSAYNWTTVVCSDKQTTSIAYTKANSIDNHILWQNWDYSFTIFH